MRCKHVEWNSVRTMQKIEDENKLRKWIFNVFNINMPKASFKKVHEINKEMKNNTKQTKKNKKTSRNIFINRILDIFSNKTKNKKQNKKT